MIQAANVNFRIVFLIGYQINIFTVVTRQSSISTILSRACCRLLYASLTINNIEYTLSKRENVNRGLVGMGVGGESWNGGVGPTSSRTDLYLAYRTSSHDEWNCIRALWVIRSTHLLGSPTWSRYLAWSGTNNAHTFCARISHSSVAHWNTVSAFHFLYCCYCAVWILSTPMSFFPAAAQILVSNHSTILCYRTLLS